MEIWSVIPGFPEYSISDLGRVKNDRRERQLKPRLNTSGAMQVTLRKQMTHVRHSYTRSLSRLVALTFLEPAKFDPEINPAVWHLNHDRTDCRAVNLKWMPRSLHYRLWAQKDQTEPIDRRPYRDVKSGIVYANSLEAANKLLLSEEMVVWTTAHIVDGTHFSHRFTTRL